MRRENLDLAHSAVNAERFRLPRDRSVLREFGLAGRYVAGIVGRLRPEKGHRHLFEALPKVIQAKPDFALLAVGSGSLEGELMALAGRLGLERHVRFAGFRTDVPRILNALDLFVMPSISEGLGTAALEAGAAGLPIVASREGGITDIITDGEHGLLAPPGDAPALAEAIVRMTLDRDLAARCAHAVRQRVCAEFSEEALVEKNDAIYRAWFERRALIAG